jgi:hypothetical protein
MYKRTLIYVEPFLARRHTKVVYNYYAAISRTRHIRLASACNQDCYGSGILCHVVTCTSAASIGGVERQNSSICIL